MSPIKTAEEWFDKNYEKNCKRLTKVAYRILTDTELAKDVVELAFEKLLTRYDKLRKHTKIEGWLVITVRNLAWNERNRAYHDMEVPFSLRYDRAAGDEPESLLAVLPQGLKEDERQILCLAYEYEFSHEEIAARLGCSAEASRMRLYRAKKHYKKLVLLEES